LSLAPRTYTVEEANEKLPEVRRLVEVVVDRSGALPELQEAVAVADYRASRPGAGAEQAAAAEEAARTLHEAELMLAAAVEGLRSLGVAIKDPASGLVDFYSYREGQLVELCWRLGEPTVANWHRIGEGFAGRKPL
jgi:hypothetical protein